MAKKHARRQIGGFAAAILAWILCCISMGLPHWRVWSFEKSKDSKPRMTLVGMWRTCVYHQESNSTISRACYQYTYQDTFIPLDIRVAQHLLLVSIFLGMFSTVSVIVALRKLYKRSLRRKLTRNPFIFPAIVNIVASSFVFLSILYNYLSITRNAGIDFPPYFHTPSFPDTQKVGIALVMATISSFLFLVSGLISFSFTLPRHHYMRSII